MRPEPERDHPFTKMVARVGKLDVDVVPLGSAVITAASRPGPNFDTDPPRSPRSRRQLRYRTSASELTAPPMAILQPC